MSPDIATPRPPQGIRRLGWDFRYGWYGLILVCGFHQAVTAVVFAVDVWFLEDRVLPVMWPHLQPVVLGAAAIGAFSMWRKWTRARAKLAHALMVMAYGIRAMSLTIAAIRFDEWSTTTVSNIVTWVALAAVADIGWAKERRRRA